MAIIAISTERLLAATICSNGPLDLVLCECCRRSCLVSSSSWLMKFGILLAGLGAETSRCAKVVGAKGCAKVGCANVGGVGTLGTGAVTMGIVATTLGSGTSTLGTGTISDGVGCILIARRSFARSSCSAAAAAFAVAMLLKSSPNFVSPTAVSLLAGMLPFSAAANFCAASTTYDSGDIVGIVIYLCRKCT